MRHVALSIAAIALAGSGWSSGPARADAGALCSSYRVVHDWPLYPPGFLLGDGAGVAVDSAGDILAFHRAGRSWTEPLPIDPIASPVLIAFDARSGRTLRQWGAGLFAMPHGLSTDRAGNVWVTDIAFHQVIKLSPQGTVLMVLGERGIAGDDTAHFNKPTDVLVLPDGSFYVSDGYGNARIMKFDARGRFLFQWGTRGDSAGQFKIPHSLALTAGGQIAVADRGNDRVQLFTQTGEFVRQWTLPDHMRPFALAALPGGGLAVVGNRAKTDRMAETSGGFVTDEAGRIISRFGGYGRGDGQFIAVHDLAIDARGALYAINVADARVQKFQRNGAQPCR